MKAKVRVSEKGGKELFEWIDKMVEGFVFFQKEEQGQYLYLKGATRQFLVDTNNLYLSLDTDEGAALEPFKRAHRYLDVLKVAREIETTDLQNQRRAAQINLPGQYDPDVEKVIVVGGNGPAPAPPAAAAREAALVEALGGRLGGGNLPADAPEGAGGPGGNGASPAVGGDGGPAPE